MQATSPPSATAQQQAPPASRQLKKRKAETDATAKAFMLLFKALPAAAKLRIVELIEEYEDELDEKQLAAERLANPADFDPANAVPWEQVKAELADRDQSQPAAQPQAA